MVRKFSKISPLESFCFHTKIYFKFLAPLRNSNPFSHEFSLFRMSEQVKEIHVKTIHGDSYKLNGSGGSRSKKMVHLDLTGDTNIDTSVFQGSLSEDALQALQDAQRDLENAKIALDDAREAEAKTQKDWELAKKYSKRSAKGKPVPDKFKDLANTGPEVLSKRLASAVKKRQKSARKFSEFQETVRRLERNRAACNSVRGSALDIQHLPNGEKRVMLNAESSFGLTTQPKFKDRDMVGFEFRKYMTTLKGMRKLDLKKAISILEDYKECFPRRHPYRIVIDDFFDDLKDRQENITKFSLINNLKLLLTDVDDQRLCDKVLAEEIEVSFLTGIKTLKNFTAVSLQTFFGVH